jgi:hypothetical protein
MTFFISWIFINRNVFFCYVNIMVFDMDKQRCFKNLCYHSLFISLKFHSQFHNDMSINKNPRRKHSTWQGSICKNNDNHTIIFRYTKCSTKVESYLAQKIVEGHVHRMMRDFLMWNFIKIFNLDYKFLTLLIWNNTLILCGLQLPMFFCDNIMYTSWRFTMLGTKDQTPYMEVTSL